MRLGPERAGAIVASITLAALVPIQALAHAGERGFIMLLPTRLYQVGGAVVVALSFFAVMGLHSGRLQRWLEAACRRLGPAPCLSPWSNALCCAALVVLVAAGFLGSRDPMENPLPLSIWTLTWVGLTFAHVLLGHLWPALDPWPIMARGVRGLLGIADGAAAPLRYPGGLGHWPATALLLLFAWYELVYPAPQDPAILAWTVLAYTVFTVAGMVLFGEQVWSERVELFSCFFRMLSWVAPIQKSLPAEGQRPYLVLMLPGAGLLSVGPLPVARVAFVILALATVSFDGLSRSFWWLDLVGENPLEHPGRTALMARNGAGLLAAPVILFALYAGSIALGARLSGMAISTALRGLVVSIVPIAFSYHFAHYLPSFVVDVQYAVKALSDPFHQGWDLLGIRALHVKASFLSNHESVTFIWYWQVSAIVGAHVAAVVIAHALMSRESLGRWPQVVAEAPLTAAMVAYTLFGLWLLSTPVAG